MPEPHTVTLAPQGEAGLASVLFIFFNFCLESDTQAELRTITQDLASKG